MKNKRAAAPQPPAGAGSLLSWIYRNKISIAVLVVAAVVFVCVYVYANTPETDTYTTVAVGTVTSVRGTEYYTGSEGDTSATGIQQLEVVVTEGELEHFQFNVESSFGSISGEQYQPGDTIYLNVVMEDGQVASVGVTDAAALEQTVLTYESAKVLEVLSDDSYQDESVENAYRGDQTLRVELTSGSHKGEVVTVTNYLGPLARSHVSEGEKLTVEVSEQGGELTEVSVMDYNRQWVLLGIVLVFVLVTVLVGGRTGLKSILGLLFTIVCLIFILVPLLLKGFDTVWTVFGICAFITVVCFTILDGISRKSVCSMLGTISGVALAACFAAITQSLTRVNGYRLIGEGVEALLNLRQSGTPIQLSGLLVGGIMISALGAVMDVAMSVSSAVSELAEVNPDMTQMALWKSAMNIGRDMVGTMTNTLILAFVGGSLVMIIYYYAINTTMVQLLGSYWFCAEIVKGLASSIGVILSVPLTALISSWLFGSRAAAKQSVKKPAKK